MKRSVIKSVCSLIIVSLLIIAALLCFIYVDKSIEYKEFFEFYVSGNKVEVDFIKFSNNHNRAINEFSEYEYSSICFSWIQDQTIKELPIEGIKLVDKNGETSLSILYAGSIRQISSDELSEIIMTHDTDALKICLINQYKAVVRSYEEQVLNYSELISVSKQEILLNQALLKHKYESLARYNVKNVLFLENDRIKAELVNYDDKSKYIYRIWFEQSDYFITGTFRCIESEPSAIELFTYFLETVRVCA